MLSDSRVEMMLIGLVGKALCGATAGRVHSSGLGLGVGYLFRCAPTHTDSLSSTAQLTSRLCPGLSTRAVDPVTPAAATGDAILLLHSRDM